MSREELEAFVLGLGERRYRGRQLYAWLYEKGARDFAAMTDLAKPLRETLERCATVEGIGAVSHTLSATDGTTKYLFELGDKRRIETVLIPPASAFRPGEAEREEEQRRLTLCVSTQVGCPLDCAFCATATMGFLRNLTAGEIVDQLRQVSRFSRRRITNIVCMGMGEPLLNYDALMKAVGIWCDGMGIAPRRITVSTAGWVDGIIRLEGERLGVRLAVSLHSAVQSTRERLMPVARKFPLDLLLSSLESYYRRTRVRVTFEYIFFDGVNDTDREVAALIKVARRVPSKINVIPFHPIAFAAPAGPALSPSPKVDAIVRQLRAADLTVMVRSSAGEDITAACGQLAVRHDRAASRGRASSTRVFQEP